MINFVFVFHAMSLKSSTLKSYLHIKKSNYLKNELMAKLSKQSVTEIVRIVITSIISILTTLGVLSCTVYSGNQTDRTPTTQNEY